MRPASHQRPRGAAAVALLAHALLLGAPGAGAAQPTPVSAPTPASAPSSTPASAPTAIPAPTATSAPTARPAPSSPGPTPTPAPSSAVAPSSPAPPPPADAATALRLANTAAQVGDWAQVERLTTPLLARPLSSADRAEVHRLLGLSFFFAQRFERAEAELLAYLRLDADAHLDPAIVPPEAITFFENVQVKHRAELRALRTRRAQLPPKRSLLLALVPVAGQLQNGDRGKAWLFGAAIGALAITNVTTYAVLRSWCRESDGTCDRGEADHSKGARRLATVNLISGAGLVVVAGVAMYDSLTGYRRSLRVSPTIVDGNLGASFVGSF